MISANQHIDKLHNKLMNRQSDSRKCPCSEANRPKLWILQRLFFGGLSTLAHSVRFSQIDLPRPSEEAFLVAQKLPLQKLGSQE